MRNHVTAPPSDGLGLAPGNAAGGEAPIVMQRFPPAQRPAPHPAMARDPLLADFAAALRAGDQLRLVYQPRIALAAGRCCAVEALLRWRHPVRGELSPAAFIPVIESDPMIGQLTDWVLNAAMGFAQILSNAAQEVRVSVNVSPNNLVIGYLVGRLVELMGLYPVSPPMLELEFTEGALIGDDERTRQQLQQIRRIGIGVAIDDFGAGYSNLRYFRQIPADTIKIDRSLVADIETDRASATIVRWLIGLGHELGFRVVAEGLETLESRDLLAAWGCDEGQGYALGRPMEADALLQWLAAGGAPG
jgi:EAL domain-containing protein (putative c-di-GMP-specific phosphodiesterase class I)